MSTGWTVPPKIWEFVEQMFCDRTPFLTPTLPTLEPIRVYNNNNRAGLIASYSVKITKIMIIIIIAPQVMT